MEVAADRLAEWLDYVFEHEGWHVSLWDSVKDITATQAASAPSPQRNSICRIVNHVALRKEDGARRIAGEPHPPAGWHKDVDWQAVPESTEEAWRGHCSGSGRRTPA